MRRTVILLVFLVCGSLLAVLTPTSSPLPPGDVWTWVQADPERGLLALVGGAAWLLAAWLLLVTGLSLLSAATGSTGRLAGRLARVVTPLALRRVLEASLGVALAVGPAGAAVASPSSSSTVGVTLNALTPPPAPIVAPAQLPVPNLDRPGSTVMSTLPSATPKPTATPEPTATPTPTATAPSTPIPSSHVPGAAAKPPPAAKGHTVLAGDTLWAIAAAELPPSATPLEITLAWQRWYQQNQTLIGADPALIVPGQLLVDHQPIR